jgi:hypothetical protein
MPAALIFLIHLIAGYVAWLLCFSVYLLPRLKSMGHFEAQRVIATIHSFRFFGLVFILPGFVGPNLPASFAVFAAYGDFATGILALCALISAVIKDKAALLVFCHRLQRNRRGRHPDRLLPRHSRQPSRSCR